MAETAKSVLMLFLGDPATDRRIQSFERLFREAGWSVELLTIQPTRKRGPRRFAEYHRRLAQAVRVRRADVVMACDLYSLSAAAWMRGNGRAAHLIYDAREVYTELPAVAGKPIRRAIWRRLQRKGLAKTDLMIVTAPHDLQAILNVHSFVPRSLLIRNLPWKNEALTKDRAHLAAYGIPVDSKVVVYVGGLQQGRGLEASIASIKSIQVLLLLIGDGAIRDSLEKCAIAEGVSDRVHFAGAMPSNKALEIAAACDAGLVLVEPISKSYELALPSKLFEYMMAGLPVVTSRMQHVLELFEGQPWIEFVDITPDSIRVGITKVLERPQPSEASQLERQLALDQYHFETDAAPLLALLKRSLSTLER